MTITSGLSIDSKGDLSDIPLGQNGDIARLAEGGYALIAEAAGLDNSVLRIFNAAGESVKSFGIQGDDPAISVLSDGSIAVMVQDGSEVVIHKVTSNFQTIQEVSRLTGLSGSVSAGNAGTFVSATLNEFPTDRDVILTIHDAAGVASPEISVEALAHIDSSDAQVIVLANGNIAISRTQTDVNTGDISLVVSILDPTGAQVVPDVVIPDSAGGGNENTQARMAATATGFALVYSTRVFGFANLDIRLRSFDMLGVQTGDRLITNENIGNTGTDDGFADTAPDIAIGPDGSIVVTWTRNDGINTDQMIRVLGQGNDTLIGFDHSENLQGQPLVTFFGTGQIAAYHFDESLNALVGEHHSGFRDSFGDDGDDVFQGDDFIDLINGLGGRDTLSGGNNDDTVQGGDGRDTLYGNDGNDVLEGEEGVGTESGGNHADKLFGGAGDDKLFGENGDDILDGGNDDDILAGGLDDDRLKGGSGEDDLFGDNGSDVLIGGSGGDTLAGGLGLDRLTGSGGADQFLVLHAVEGNRDHITDFVSGTDTIALDLNAFFSTIGFQVNESQLRFCTAAQDNDDFLIYNSATGQLLFDIDGNGNATAFILVKIDAGSTLLHTDIELI